MEPIVSPTPLLLFQELIMTNQLISPYEPVKPNINNIGLIGMAILSSPNQKMTVHQVKKWLVKHFEYYKRCPNNRWERIVKNVLSTSFVRLNEVDRSKRHYWAVDPNREWKIKKFFGQKKVNTRSPSSSSQNHETTEMLAPHRDTTPVLQVASPPVLYSSQEPPSCRKKWKSFMIADILGFHDE